MVFPIRWPEPFGLVMVEAMACGTPVVTTNWGAAPELVEDGVTGFRRDSDDDLVDAPSRTSTSSTRGVPGTGRGTLLGRGDGARGYEAALRAVARPEPESSAAGWISTTAVVLLQWPP